MAVLPQRVREGLQLTRGRKQVHFATSEQGSEEAGEGGVEGDGGMDRGALPLRDAVLAQGPVEVVDEATVHHHDALGAAGAAGGVEDVGEVLCRHRGRGKRLGLPREQRRIRVEQHAPFSPRRQHRRQVLRRDNDQRGRVGEHVAKALGGVAGVQWEEGTAGLEDTEDGDHQLDGTLQVERDEAVRANAQRAQMPSQLIGASVQLPIGEGGVGEAQSRGVRSSLDLGFEEEMGAGAAGEVTCGGVPLHQHALSLGRVHQRELGQAPLRMCGDALQQRLQVRGHPRDGASVEQVGGVVETTTEALGRLFQREVQVKPGGQ